MDAWGEPTVTPLTAYEPLAKTSRNTTIHSPEASYAARYPPLDSLSLGKIVQIRERILKAQANGKKYFVLNLAIQTLALLRM